MADVLSAAGIYDGRTIAEADVAAWHAAVGQYDREDALAAVVRHYADSTEWMKPAHLKQHILAIRNERANARNHPVRELPSRFETDEIRDQRIAKGVTILADHWKAPEGPPTDDLHGQALLRARRERGKREIPGQRGSRVGGKSITMPKFAPPPWADPAAAERQAIEALHHAGKACGRSACPRCADGQ
jgi:hypothetical protein